MEMKGSPIRFAVGLSIVVAAVLVTFALRLVGGERPTFHFLELALGALLVVFIATGAVWVVGVVVLSAVRAGTRKFRAEHPEEFMVRVRNVSVSDERLGPPYYRFLTVDGEGLKLWSSSGQNSADYTFDISEIDTIKRGDRDAVIAHGTESRALLKFEAVPSAPLALRSVHGRALDELVASIVAHLPSRNSD